MSTDPTIQELRALVGLITQSLDTIESTTTTRGEKFPSLNEPFTRESEAIRSLPDVAAACDVLVSAAGQLIATIRSPGMSVIMTTLQHEVPAALGVAVQLHVPEILRDAGPKGLHAKDIAAHTQVDDLRLSRILRLLAANHIFTEVSPDTYATNRLSSVVDTGKSIASIMQDPAAKHDGTPGIVALFESMLEETPKASSYMYESLVDPRTRASTDAKDAAFTLAYKTGVSYFDWLHRPGNEYRRKRFDIAMIGGQHLMPAHLIFEGFDWAALPADSVIVDVGGGVGSQTLVLAKAFSHLNFVVQDLERTVADGKQHFEKELPDALASGKVKFQAHDFFTPQPVQSPAVFLVRRILHDWPDKDVVRILRQLRAAAGPDTQLMIIETLVSYVCKDPATDVPGAAVQAPPAPLLANGGYAQSMNYMFDLSMLNMFNGEERTLLRFQTLLEESGWQLSRVHRVQGPQCKVIARPAPRA